MAILDPRVIPLIETLAAAGIDWLAFELIEGIRRGREAEETSEALSMSREQARQQGAPWAKGEPQAGGPEAHPILGDAQIEWAARYISDRLDASLAELLASFDHLGELVGGQPTRLDSDPARQTVEQVVVLLDGEVPRTIRRADAERAVAQMPALRAALEKWVTDARGAATA